MQKVLICRKREELPKPNQNEINAWACDDQGPVKLAKPLSKGGRSKILKNQAEWYKQHSDDASAHNKAKLRSGPGDIVGKKLKEWFKETEKMEAFTTDEALKSKAQDIIGDYRAFLRARS